MSDGSPTAPPPSPRASFSAPSRSDPPLPLDQISTGVLADAPRKRRVQWVGVTNTIPEGDGDRDEAAEPRRASGAGLPHVAITIPDDASSGPVEGELSAEGAHINTGSLPDIESMPHRDGYEADITIPNPDGSNASTPDSSRPPSPLAGLDILPGERDGLPTDPRRKPRTFDKEANRLISLHKWRWCRTSRPDGATTSGSGRTLTSAALRNKAKREARESSSAALGQGHGGGGVLSSLLRLYDQSNSHSSSATLVGSDDHSDDEGSEASSHEHPRRPGLARAPHSASSFNLAHGARAASRSVASGVRSLTAEVSDRLEARDRPAAARSKAGVFGALQASAIGLAGAATPANAHVAPNPSRPGFRISRYSTGDVPTLSQFGPRSAPSSPPSGGRASFALPERSNAASASADDVTKIRDQHQPGSGGSSTAVSVDPHGDGTRPASIAGGEYLTSPAAASEPIGGSYFASRGSGDQRSGATSPHGASRARGSHLNLKALTEALKPHAYHNQSAVLKAKRLGTISPSAPGTPLDDEIQLSLSSPPLKSAGGKNGALKKRKKEKRREEEIYIKLHIAQLLQRQQFILQLTRALMMFGGPSHRLESQIQSTAKVLDLDLQVVLIYSIAIFSFQDPSTHTSETKFIKQGANVDLGKLLSISTLHWEVVHDEISVGDASQEISRLMLAKPHYNRWQIVVIGALCSAFIGPSSFRASFIDVLVSIPLGASLVAAQTFVATKSDVLSQMFEIMVTAISSFAAAALASTGYFCYTAVISSSIVLILPGWLVCLAALELQSRSIVSGSVRLIWAIIYALFLGLGISFGAQFWYLVTGDNVQVNPNGQCQIYRGPGPVPWWRVIVPDLWWLLTVPGYSFCLALRQQTPIFCKEMVVMVILSCGGWAANHFSSLVFVNRSDISSAIGSFVVGLAANLYGKAFQGTAFIVALTAVLFQLPSGLSNGGLLALSVTDTETDTFANGFSVAEQLLQVSLGLVIGLFSATVVVYPLGRRRGGLMVF